MVGAMHSNEKKKFSDVVSNLLGFIENNFSMTVTANDVVIFSPSPFFPVQTFKAVNYPQNEKYQGMNSNNLNIYYCDSPRHRREKTNKLKFRRVPENFQLFLHLWIEKKYQK